MERVHSKPIEYHLCAFNAKVSQTSWWALDEPAASSSWHACRKGLKVHTTVPYLNCVQYYLAAAAADVPFSPDTHRSLQFNGNVAMGTHRPGCDWRSWYIVLACTKIGPRYGKWRKSWWHGGGGGENNNILCVLEPVRQSFKGRKGIMQVVLMHVLA